MNCESCRNILRIMSVISWVYFSASFRSLPLEEPCTWSPLHLSLGNTENAIESDAKVDPLLTQKVSTPIFGSYTASIELVLSIPCFSRYLLIDFQLLYSHLVGSSNSCMGFKYSSSWDRSSSPPNKPFEKFLMFLNCLLAIRVFPRWCDSMGTLLYTVKNCKSRRWVRHWGFPTKVVLLSNHIQDTFPYPFSLCHHPSVTRITLRPLNTFYFPLPTLSFWNSKIRSLSYRSHPRPLVMQRQFWVVGTCSQPNG